MDIRAVLGRSRPSPRAQRPPRLAELVAGSTGWSAQPPTAQFCRFLARELRRANGTVVVAGGPDAAVWARVLRLWRPALDVVEVPVTADAAQVHLRLSAGSRIQAVLDTSDESSAEQVDLFERLFGHLAVHRPYVVAQVRVADGADLWTRCATAQTVRVWRQAGRSGTEVTRDRDLRGLGRCIGRLEAVGGGLVVTARKPSMAKIPESGAGGLFRLRPAVGEVIRQLPETELRSRCEYTDNRDARDPHRLDVFPTPRLELRRYDEAVCGPQQLVTSGRLLMPDSFRFNQQHRLVNTGARELSRWFAHPVHQLGDPVALPGSWYHLDTEVQGHFGHFMTEQVSRLWGLEDVLSRDPGTRVLISMPRKRSTPGLTRYERDILATHGVAENDVLLFEGAVRVERLYTATPMFSCPDRGHDEIGTPYIHPDIIETWRRIGDRLAASAPLRRRPRRIFCSRRSLTRRPCHNVRDLERFFEKQGFTVVFPEDYSPAEQVATFRSAEVVAGFAGSALFTLALCDSPKQVIALAPTSYTGRNEYPISAALGHRLSVVWSKPDFEHPPGGWNFKAFYSGFTFDFGDEGEFLREVLAGSENPARGRALA